MKLDLEPAKNVLLTFQMEIATALEMQSSISMPIFAPFLVEDRTPDFSGIHFEPISDSLTEKENAYRWLYADLFRL